ERVAEHRRPTVRRRPQADDVRRQRNRAIVTILGLVPKRDVDGHWRTDIEFKRLAAATFCGFWVSCGLALPREGRRRTSGKCRCRRDSFAFAGDRGTRADRNR